MFCGKGTHRRGVVATGATYRPPTREAVENPGPRVAPGPHLPSPLLTSTRLWAGYPCKVD